jgi:hypothetical protein
VLKHARAESQAVSLTVEADRGTILGVLRRLRKYKRRCYLEQTYPEHFQSHFPRSCAAAIPDFFFCARTQMRAAVMLEKTCGAGW